jgi:hypothetical protein
MIKLMVSLFLITSQAPGDSIKVQVICDGQGVNYIGEDD